jgi:hypothetical protein
MSPTIEEAFAELHHLHVREALRRFQPQWMLVAVDDHDRIVKTQKFKEVPDVPDLKIFGADCRGTAIFIAGTDSFKTLDEFSLAVRDSGEAIRKRRAGIVNDPDTYYGGRL